MMLDYKNTDKTEWFIQQMKRGWLTRREIVAIAAEEFPSTTVRTLNGTIGQYWSDSVNSKWGTYKAIRARGLKVEIEAQRRRIVESNGSTLRRPISLNSVEPYPAISKPTKAQDRNNGIGYIWNNNDCGLWQKALDRYWTHVKPSNFALEQEMDQLDVGSIRKMDPQAWRNFLLEKYFRWKYTAPNRYGSTTKVFNEHGANDGMLALHAVKEKLFTLDKHDIEGCLALASSIPGLGTAGASGLLAILFPTYFGTVDQFAVKALRTISELPQRELIVSMNPESLKLTDGVILIRIMRRKAAELNKTCSTREWTPRRVDMVLWTCAR